MQIWDIQKLKQNLRADKLPEKDAFRYLLATIIIGLIPIPTRLQSNDSEYNWIIGLALTVAGLIYCYNKNNGSLGWNFLYRFVSIALVIFIRLLVFLSPIVFLLVLITLYNDFSDADSQSIEMLFSLLVYLYIPFYYWRVGYHIGDLSGKTNEMGTV